MRPTLFVVLLLLLIPTASLADNWTASVGFGTTFPIASGGRVATALPYGFEATASVGVMPDAYVRAINDFVVSFEGYDAATAELVEQSLSRSLVTTAAIGLPVSRAIKLRAGYGVVTLGGDATLADVVAFASNAPLPPVLNGAPLEVSSELRVVTTEIGGTWKFTRHVGLYIGGGAVFTVQASTSITADVPARLDSSAQSFLRDAEAYLDNIYTSYGYTPTFSTYLTVGF